VRAIQEFNVANLTGSEGITTFMLPIGVNSDPRARREAIMENDDLSKGIILGDQTSFGVDPSDDHVAHADEHLKPLEAIVAASQQQGQQPAQGQPAQPPTQITPDHLMALQGIIPHVSVHVQYLSMDETKRDIYKQMNQRLKLVESVAKGIVARLARAQKGMVPGQPVDPSVLQTAVQPPSA